MCGCGAQFVSQIGTRHRNATGGAARSGRARTCPASRNATAGGCGAFPANLSGRPCEPIRTASRPAQARRTLAARSRRARHERQAVRQTIRQTVRRHERRTVADCPARLSGEIAQERHRDGTGGAARSGRARTRPAHGNATAGGCGAFPAIVPAPCPARSPRHERQAVRRAMRMYAYAMRMYAYAMQRRKKEGRRIKIQAEPETRTRARARAHARAAAVSFRFRQLVYWGL